MNLLFEDMIRVETGQFICRIWRQQVKWDLNNHTLALAAKEYMLETQHLSRMDMIQKIVDFDGVNSVEIIDRFTGCGVCVHKDWP